MLAGLAPLHRERLLWKVQLDTYERETERYGGPDGIELAERLFHADSEAVLDTLDTLSGDEGAELVGRVRDAAVDVAVDVDAGRLLEVLLLLARDSAQCRHCVAQARARGITLRLDMPAVDLVIDVDRDRIIELLSNLISNALKFTQQGGVVFSMERAGGAVRFSVSDSGPGIAAESQAVIFEEFRRLDQAMVTAVP